VNLGRRLRDRTLDSSGAPARFRGTADRMRTPQDSVAGSRASRLEFVLRLMSGGALVAPHSRTSIAWAPIAHTESGGRGSERSESEKRSSEGEARNEPTAGHLPSWRLGTPTLTAGDGVAEQAPDQEG
jgi:hypothetical protein